MISFVRDIWKYDIYSIISLVIFNNHQIATLKQIFLHRASLWNFIKKLFIPISNRSFFNKLTPPSDITSPKPPWNITICIPSVSSFFFSLEYQFTLQPEVTGTQGRPLTQNPSQNRWPLFSLKSRQKRKKNKKEGKKKNSGEGNGSIRYRHTARPHWGLKENRRAATSRAVVQGAGEGALLSVKI